MNGKSLSHREIILKWIDLYSIRESNFEEIKRKFKEFEKYVHQNFVLIMLPYREKTEFHGIDGLWQHLKENKEGLPDVNMEVLDMYGEHSSIAVRTILRATHTGLILGISPSGKKIQGESVLLFKFEGNKIKEIRVVTDALTIFMQVGQAILLKNEQEQIDGYLENLIKLGLLPKNQ
ncbi:MAG: ester cyclase [Candidatus Kariarchaeaceae archaeon]|jgi:predicted ester cyclase